ncbi:MAG TPA: tetratricopeptide repeat protein, partial [Terriglobales bacterium]|nr:tetratricopeptide repeat protein [Terriglobales bacterium]
MRQLAQLFLVLFSLGATAFAQTADEADSAYRAQQWEKAASAYQKITAAEPQNGLAWFRLGTAQIHLGHYADAAAAFERAESLKFAPLYTPYNLAAAYARMGNKEKALAALGIAADRGFQQPDLLEKDDDFASLRDDAGYQQALAR